MSDKHIDAQLQAIEQELLTAPLPETLEINSPEPVQIPRRKRSLLTRVRRQYDRLDDRYQTPVKRAHSLAESTKQGLYGVYSWTMEHPKVVIAGAIGFVTTIVCTLALFQHSVVQAPTDSDLSQPTLQTGDSLPEGAKIRTIYTEITAVSESRGWSKYTPVTKTEHIQETISLPQ